MLIDFSSHILAFTARPLVMVACTAGGLALHIPTTTSGGGFLTMLWWCRLPNMMRVFIFCICVYVGYRFVFSEVFLCVWVGDHYYRCLMKGANVELAVVGVVIVTPGQIKESVR